MYLSGLLSINLYYKHIMTVNDASGAGMGKIGNIGDLDLENYHISF